MKYVLGILIVGLMTGCSYNCTQCVNVCPVMKVPKADVLEKIEGLHDADVDQWIIDMYRLHKKLRIGQPK